MNAIGLNEVKQCIEDAESPADPREQTLVAISLTELLEKELPPRENLLAPWLPKSGLCMVYAKRGIGKTFFALEIAMAVTYGISFLSFSAPKPARVLYVDGEMPANAMQERLGIIKQRLNLPAPITDLQIITPDLQNGIMPDISTIEGQEALQPYVEQADLIIFDNLSTLVGSGKENEAESWGPIQSYVLNIRKQGKSVLFIHHAGKNGTQRGTSKKEDILDTVIALKQPSDYQPSDGARFEVHFEKARGIIGDCINPLSCKLTEKGWEVTSIEQDNYKLVVDLAQQGYKQKDIVETLNISKSYVSRLFNQAIANGDLKASK